MHVSYTCITYTYILQSDTKINEYICYSYQKMTLLNNVNGVTINVTNKKMYCRYLFVEKK